MASKIENWLTSIGLGTYIDAFINNALDFELLPHLTNEDLKDLGIAKLGDRKRLLLAIEQLEQHSVVTSEKPTNLDAQTSDHMEAERRQLTVMFVDLVGSTALSERLDPEELREGMIAYQNAVAGVVTRFDGHIAKYMGDGVLCYFGWPRAHEDDAERAVRAGTKIMKTITEIKTSAGQQLSARAGVATGLVVVGDLIGQGAAQEEAVLGSTPNLAARMQGLARPGQVVIADATRRLIGQLFDLTHLGGHHLKGISGETAAFIVNAERAVESRFEARSSGTVAEMVGRDHELGIMLDRWRQSKSGEGQLLLLTGEAGIGKSRITRAVLDAVEEDSHTRISIQCSPYHTDSALYPVIQQLTHAAEIKPGDSNDDKLDKLEASLVSGSAQFIGALLGLETDARYGHLNLEPQQLRIKTLHALVEDLMSRAREKPVLLVLEDVHWIDATTLELVDLCLDQMSDARLFMLLTARPTFEHGFSGHPIVTKLVLNRLGREQITSLILKLTKGKSLPNDLLDEIAAKTDGVPLFVEELTKSVLESGGLREDETGFSLIGPISHLAIPSTLHDSLMARLDRLQPVKEVAQMAACIGREFEYHLLAQISPLEDQELQDALDRLISAELIFRRGLPPQAHFLFKHALVRDAAYESLLKTRRQAIHAKLSDTLESHQKAVPELLAHHATEAGYTDRAITYWQLAGEQASQRSANIEAIAHTSQAISILQKREETADRDRQELELQTLLAGSLIPAKGYGAPQTVRAFDRMRELSAHVRDPKLLFPVFYGQWVYRFIKGGGRSDVLRHADRFLELANVKEQTGAKVVGHRILAAVLFYQGQLNAAAEHFRKSIALYRPEEHDSLTYQFGQHSKAGAMAFLSNTLHLLGYADQAIEFVNDSIDTARQSNHLHTVAYSLFFGSIRLCFCRGDLVGFQNGTAELSAIAEEYKLPMWLACAHTQEGWSLSQMGDHERAIFKLRQGLEGLEATGTSLDTPMVLGQLAQTYAASGRYLEALEMIEQALLASQQTNEHWYKPELLRLKGLWLSRLKGADAMAETKEVYQQSLKIAQAQGAKYWELRTSVSQARLCAEQGLRTKAHDQLRPVVDWFKEGSDMLDVRDAKELLQKLI